MGIHLPAAQLAAFNGGQIRKRVTQIDVLQGGQTLISGVRMMDDPGSVAVSSTNAARRTCSLNLLSVGGDLVPTSASSALAPYGNEVRVSTGVMLGSTPILVPCGVFRIDQCNPSWAGGNVPVGITGTDRSAVIANDKYTDYTSVAAQNAGSAILAIVSPAFQSWWPPPNFVAVSQNLSAQTFAPGDDRWAAAQNLATQVGCLLYFDPYGVLTLTPIVNPQTAQIAWTFAPGLLSVLTQAAQTLDRTNAANIIVAQAQGSSVTTPLQAIAQDLNPASPTYVLGNFSAAVSVVQSETLTLLADLQTYASSQLLLSQGATQTATLSSFCLPQLDAYDVIAASVAQVGLAAKYVIDQLSVPLGPGQMSLTTRSILV